MSRQSQKSKFCGTLPSTGSGLEHSYVSPVPNMASLCDSTYQDLDRVYHSETMCEMEVQADLLGVDLCNPYVLLFLAKQTVYHHAFWPHTKKRFTAFKNVLRRNRLVRKSLDDMRFYALISSMRDDMLKFKANPLYDTPGIRQEMQNINQVIEIVEKAIAGSKST